MTGPNGNGSYANGQPYASKLAGVGGRTSLRSAVTGMVASESSADYLRAKLSEPERMDKLIAALDAGVESGDRTCLRIVSEAHKLVGTQVNLAVQIVQTVGAEPHEARDAVEARRRAAALASNPRALAVRLAQHLRKLCTDHGWTVEELEAEGSGAEVLP